MEEKTTASTETITVPPGSRVRYNIAAATTPAAGNVNSQAVRMERTIPHRTEESLRAAPAPSIEPVTVCVVDTGKPKWAVVKRMAAVEVSAAKPW